MRTVWILLALGAALTAAGCQSEAATYQTVRLPSGDYDRTFEVTQQVLSEHFTVEKADKGTGRVVCSPQGVPEGEEVSGTVVNLPGTVRGMRRVVTAQVSPTSGTTLVSVKVQLEVAEAAQAVPRPTYSEYEPTTTGAESRVYIRPEEQTGLMWRKAGSDAGMERKLLGEIERRLKAAGTEEEPAKETPEETPEEDK